MAINNQLSVVEQIDKMHQRIALGVFLVSVAYALSVIRFLVNEKTSGMLDTASQVVGVFVIILVLPAFVKFLRIRRDNRAACAEPEGFVIEMFNRATGRAFQFTFLFLIVLEIVSKNLLSHLPGEFFIKLIISVTLAIFSLTFFFLNRVDDNEDDFATGAGL